MDAANQLVPAAPRAARHGGPPGKPPTVWMDGALREAAAAAISVFDRGLLYGDGVFAVLRAAAGRAVDLHAHLEQLLADAGLVWLPTPSASELADAVETVLGAWGHAPARLRVVLTGGPGGLAVRLTARAPGHVVVIAEEPGATPAGARAIVLEELRLSPSRQWAPKSLSYQSALWARELARERGADEALRLFPDDTVGEGAASNVFAVLGDSLVTPPPLGIRPGVTRRRVLLLGAARGLRVVERALSRDELVRADELLLTSSVAGVVPIIELDGVARSAGPVARALARDYEAFASAA